LIFLISHRSPDIELVADRGSIGGWGLGGGQEEKTRLGQEEEEDEPPCDWDQAQVCLIDMLKICKYSSINSTGGCRKDGWFKHTSRLAIQIDVI
jgi:hypothetical protein